jgi:hypothetical protein
LFAEFSRRRVSEHGEQNFQRRLPKEFAVVHPVIAGLLAKDEERRKKHASSRFDFPWERPKFDAPFERRRLAILNGLFLGFAKVGGRPWVHDKEARKLGIALGGLR